MENTTFTPQSYPLKSAFLAFFYHKTEKKALVHCVIHHFFVLLQALIIKTN